MKPMMNDDGLLECPFCGSDEAYECSNGGFRSVICNQCGCRTEWWLKPLVAVNSWNTRNGQLYTADDYKQDAMEREYGL